MRNKNSGSSLLHPKNPHRGRYNFKELIIATPELVNYLRENPKGDSTIDFADSSAVLCLNRALLKHYYNIGQWNIPKGYLCPPIPGRADYIHYISDLIDRHSTEVNVLDIGTGANCIYPIIGSQTYHWTFTASDIDEVSIKNADSIIESNIELRDKIRTILQKEKGSIFKGIIKEGDYYDLTMCNPPFHGSQKEAEDSNRRKVKNLNKKAHRDIKESLNFGGQMAELWCPGGEIFFLKKMIKESQLFKYQVKWFTTLVSKSDNVRPLRRQINKTGANKVKVIEMRQGHKISRILAWSYNP